jgi:hypothetical protein
LAGHLSGLKTGGDTRGVARRLWPKLETRRWPRAALILPVGRAREGEGEGERLHLRRCTDQCEDQNAGFPKGEFPESSVYSIFRAFRHFGKLGPE